MRKKLETKLDLSIIIVSFNTAKVTADCINSIIASRIVIPHEVIVVDNNSSDESIIVLKKFEKAKQIKVISNTENVGFAKANNQAIKIAKGKYILLLNSDTIVRVGSIEKLVKFADETPDAGVVAPKLLNKNKTIQESCYSFPTIKNAIRKYFLGEKDAYDEYYPTKNKPTIVDAVVGAAFLITPTALEKVGILSEEYFMYFEDIDYCKRVKEVGLNVYYLPDTKIVHLHGASSKTEGDEKQSSRSFEASKRYYGENYYYLLSLVLRIGRKWRRIVGW